VVKFMTQAADELEDGDGFVNWESDDYWSVQLDSLIPDDIRGPRLPHG
jgi:hypothetical protein